MDEAVQELSEWVTRELPNSRCDLPFLRRFLHGCKMRQDVARNKIRNFYKLRERTPEWFTDRDPSNPIIADLLHQGVFMLLPDKDDEGRTIVVVRATINNPRTHPMMHVFKVGMMVLDVAMEEDDSIAEHGVVVLIDLNQVTMYHGFQMTAKLIRKAVFSWQDCYPVRIKSIHFLNCPIHVNIVLSVFRKFMKEKLQRRIHTYGRDLTALLKQVPSSQLPIEYQGSNGTIEDAARYWCTFTTDRREWFLSQE